MKTNMIRANPQDLHAKNLVVIYDVLLDIEEGRQLDPERIVFALLPKIVRFAELMPADSIGLRDNYWEARWKAIKYLERIGVVRNVIPHEGNHRWETYVEVSAHSSEFPIFYAEIEREYKRRTAPAAISTRQSSPTSAGNKVFVVHGRDLRLRDGMFTFLRSISLDPIEWIEAVAMTGKSAPLHRRNLGRCVLECAGCCGAAYR